MCVSSRSGLLVGAGRVTLFETDQFILRRESSPGRVSTLDVGKVCGAAIAGFVLEARTASQVVVLPAIAPTERIIAPRTAVVGALRS